MTSTVYILLRSLSNGHFIRTATVNHSQWSWCAVGKPLCLHSRAFSTKLEKMPKKKGPSSCGKATSKTQQGPLDTGVVEKSPIVVGKDGDISIAIQVKPGAKTDRITDISDTAVGVQISAPPVDGEANTTLVKYFADLLKIKKTDVSLKGGKSRQKTILVSSSAGLTVDRITALLKAEKD